MRHSLYAHCIRGDSAPALDIEPACGHVSLLPSATMEVKERLCSQTLSATGWMQTVTSPTLPSSEGDGSVGAAKRHSAVCAHLFCTVSFSLDVNMAHSTKMLNIMAVNLLGFTVLKHTDTNTHTDKVL